METYGGSGCIDPRFLDLCTGWRLVLSFTPLPFYLQRKSLSTHWIGDWVGSIATLNDMGQCEYTRNLVRCSNDQSSWLQIQRSRVPFLVLLEFLRSSESGVGSTRPRDDN
jgi:hypothetical protein